MTLPTISTLKRRNPSGDRSLSDPPEPAGRDGGIANDMTHAAAEANKMHVG